MAMDFSLNGLLDEDKCYDQLVRVLHPSGLRCPNGHELGECGIHERDRAPLLDYRCRACRRHFNAFTGTVLSGIRYTVVQIVQMLRGFVQGVSTWQIAREIGVDRKWLLVWRHKLQGLLEKAREKAHLFDEVLEGDELYQNAGEKSTPHLDPADPPRRRANRARGHGTWNNDRPPVLGTVGRESGEIHLEVCRTSTRAELVPKVLDVTEPDSLINTDEWQPYKSLAGEQRRHVYVNHSSPKEEWARDDDGDGIREVHTNTIEGIWTGLRNFLRTFRGVHKKYLNQYVRVFEWAHNIKAVTDEFLRVMLAVPSSNAP